MYREVGRADVKHAMPARLSRYGKTIRRVIGLFGSYVSDKKYQSHDLPDLERDFIFTLLACEGGLDNTFANRSSRIYFFAGANFCSSVTVVFSGFFQ